MLIPGAGFIISHPKAGEGIPYGPSFHSAHFILAILV